MLLRTTPNSSNRPLHSTNREHTLPQELADAIIDHLYNDEPSLRTCGAVCHTWLHSARYHLFYSVDVTCSSLRSSKKFHRLLTYLEKSPRLATYVQDFKVDHTLWCVGSEEAGILLAAICSKLNNVGTLTLQRVYIPALPDHLRESLCSLFALPTLKKLSLIEFNVQTFPDLVTLLKMCTQLSSLVLFQIRWEDRGGIEGSGKTALPPISNRQFSMQEPPQDMHRISIRGLKLGGVSYRNSRSLLSFLGESVEDFELDDIFGHHRFEVDKAADFIALGSMTSLRTLRLNPSQSILSNPGSWVISLLSSLEASNRVETVFIQSKEFHLKSMPGILDWEWYRAVDETLSCCSFSKLCRVDVKVISIGPKDRPETRDLKSFFPQLERKGLICARFEYKTLVTPI